MLTIKGQSLQLYMNEDGTEIAIEDLARGESWRLDESTRLVAHGVSRFDHQAFRAEVITGTDAQVTLIRPGVARKINDTTIEARHRTPAGEMILRWVMERDRLRIIAEPAMESDLTALALPGTFRPEGATAFKAAVPLGQGVLHTGRGPAFFHPLCMHGHGGGFTLSMFGQIAGEGALVVITESDADVALHWEKTSAGAVNLMWVQHASMGALTYPRETVIFVESPNLTSICKRYRRYEIAAGRFKSWQEKITERPRLAELFGCATVFIGYHQDADLDYAESFRQLKAMGIERAYVYPTYLASTIDIQSDDFRSIDIRDQLPLLRELGYLAGSFIYIMDGPMGDGEAPLRDLRLTAEGQPAVAWQIDDLTWYNLSGGKRLAWAQKLLDDEHRQLDAVHYDVLCCTSMLEDYHPDHRADAQADRENRKAMLQYAASKGLLVSSEGFSDRMTAYYDLGSVKFAHALGGDEYCVVPMTMLVYHDSAYHLWWEVDNYNNMEHRSQFCRGQTTRLYWGGGSPRLQAAMDALMGTPPDIFPFGLQYNFVPHTSPQKYLYRFRLEDPLVREAIECAKPVMTLNARVGPCEMEEHILHTPDGAVQETVFADGTHVIANFANVTQEIPGLGSLPPESWRTR